MKRDRGFTLVEILVAIASGAVVICTALMLMTQVQHLARDLSLLCERDEGHKLGPLLSVYWIRHAGANRTLPAEATFQLTGRGIHVEADIDGEEGFPDGELRHPFETLSIRSNGEALQLRSGKGRYQPVLPRVTRFAGESQDPWLVQIELESETREELWTGGESKLTSEWTLFLPNYRPGLFPGDSP